MSEMIKRVARAICAAEGHDPDGPTCDVYMPHDPDGIYPLAGYRQQARAAIEAMQVDALAAALEEALPYVARYEREHMSNVALAVYDKGRTALALARGGK